MCIVPLLGTTNTTSSCHYSDYTCEVEEIESQDLKNYAAPSGYPGKQTTTLPVLTFTHATPTTPSFVDPPTLEMSSPTITTSADSTPLQSPTPEDEEDDKLTWSLCLENGRFATTLVPSSSTSISPSFSPNTTPIASPVLIYPSSDIGTSPPFGDGSVHWGWGATFGLSGGEESSSSSDEMMPPRRKRGLQNRESSSESGDESSPSSSIPPSTTTATVTSPPLKRQPTPPKLNLPTCTFISPNARRASQLQQHHRYFQPSTVQSPTPGGGGDSDAVYQALVREWCFAQGPTTSGEMTPKVQAGGADGVVT